MTRALKEEDIALGECFPDRMKPVFRDMGWVISEDLSDEQLGYLAMKWHESIRRDDNEAVDRAIQGSYYALTSSPFPSDSEKVASFSAKYLAFCDSFRLPPTEGLQTHHAPFFQVFEWPARRPGGGGEAK